MRHYLETGDKPWLAKHWLQIKQAMDFVINKHDPDHDGVMSGEALTTLDSTSSGTSPWLGSMYLAASRLAISPWRRISPRLRPLMSRME